MMNLLSILDAWERRGKVQGRLSEAMGAGGSFPPPAFNCGGSSLARLVLESQLAHLDPDTILD